MTFGIYRKLVWEMHLNEIVFIRSLTCALRAVMQIEILVDVLESYEFKACLLRYIDTPDTQS